ncbi:hypothetical protein [Streptomyces sp. NPDC002172]
MDRGHTLAEGGREPGAGVPGSPGEDLPETYGSWKGVDNRLRAWAIDGIWQTVSTALTAQADARSRRVSLSRLGLGGVSP